MTHINTLKFEQHVTSLALIFYKSRFCVEIYRTGSTQINVKMKPKDTSSNSNRACCQSVKIVEKTIWHNIRRIKLKNNKHNIRRIKLKNNNQAVTLNSSKSKLHVFVAAIYKFNLFLREYHQTSIAKSSISTPITPASSPKRLTRLPNEALNRILHLKQGVHKLTNQHVTYAWHLKP